MSLAGRLLTAALPLIKLRSQYRPVSLGVRGLVRDAAGRVLLVRHSYIPEWHFPGGGVEPGETAEAAVRRELAEEGGVAVDGAVRLVGLFHNTAWAKGDHVAFYAVEAWRPCPPRRDLEIEAAEFFPPDALPADAASSVRARLAEARGAPQADRW